MKLAPDMLGHRQSDRIILAHACALLSIVDLNE
jgi:hypothetical protein